VAADILVVLVRSAVLQRVFDAKSDELLKRPGEALGAHPHTPVDEERQGKDSGGVWVWRERKKQEKKKE
jgi:hypothetical protein